MDSSFEKLQLTVGCAVWRDGLYRSIDLHDIEVDGKVLSVRLVESVKGVQRITLISTATGLLVHTFSQSPHGMEGKVERIAEGDDA